MFKFILSLFRKKPATYTYKNIRQSRHVWANAAMAHVSGPGTFIVKIPADIDPQNGREAIRSRLANQFKRGTFRTKYVKELNALEVTIQ